MAEPFSIENMLNDLRAEEDIYNLATSKQIYDNSINNYNSYQKASGIPAEEVKVDKETVVETDDGITGVANVDVLEKYPELKGKLYNSNADVRLEILANASQEKNNMLAASQVQSDPAKLETAKKLYLTIVTGKR